MKIQVNTREQPNERPHVHIFKGKKPTEGDLKVWLDTLDIEWPQSSGGKYKASEVRVALLMVERLRDVYLEMWIEIHGKPAARSRKTKIKTAKRRTSKLY